MPKVSVIIPVYNVENYLRECLDSVVNQTLKDIEIICINDCSTDNSLGILQEYAANDSRIKILNNENNINAGPSRNRGLACATGEYIYFMDSDDFLEFTALEKIINKLDENKNADFCIFAHFHYDNVTRAKEKRTPLSQFTEEDFQSGTSFKKDYSKFIHSAVVPWNKVYKREFLIKNHIKFDNLKCANDRSFYIETLVKSNQIILLNENLINYRRNVEGSLISYRLQHFDCMYKSYEKVKSLTKNLEVDIQKEILDAVLIDIFGFYNSADEDNKKKITNGLRKFLRNLKFPGGKKLYKHYRWFKQYKELTRIINWQNIFSLKNSGVHKVITICGIQLKIKSSKLQKKLERIESEQHFNRKLEKLQKEFKYQLCKYMPEEKYPEYLKDWFYKCTGEELNLDNPQTFNEKIQWMKLFDSTPLKTQLADKYLVRDWVKEKIGEEYLIPLLGVWDKFDDIDFDKLPDKFVLKANHGCAWNIIVTDKHKFDKKEAKQKFDKWIHTNFAFNAGLELHYKNIKPLIIAEEYIENDHQDLYDYKIWCFGGKAQYIQFLSERKEGLKMLFYDTAWNKQDFVYSYPRNEKNIEKPKNLELLLTLAEKLAQGFSHVRVDFYILNNGSIKFGEMTFTSMSGACKWVPADTNKKIGQLIKFPEKEKI